MKTNSSNLFLGNSLSTKGLNLSGPGDFFVFEVVKYFFQGFYTDPWYVC